MARYRGFLVEVIDARTGWLRWKRFVRTEDQARDIRNAVIDRWGGLRHIRITPFNQSTLPTRTTDQTTDRWWEKLSIHEREDLITGGRRL